MKPVKAAVAAALSTESERRTDCEIPREVIARIATLWIRMTEIYGHKWSSSYGETDTHHTWARALIDISPEEMKRGFYTCLRNGQPWPPSAPEFRAMCRPPKDQREHAAMYREYQVPLPHLKTEDEIARGRAQLAAMRATALGAGIARRSHQPREDNT